MLPIGMQRLDIQPFAAFLAPGEVLDQQPAGQPAGFGIARHADADQRRQLLALVEIAFDGGRQAVAFQRDNALIAFGIGGLVERDGEMAVAEQLAQASCLR